MKKLILIAITSLGLALPVLANPFRNLGFDEVDPSHLNTFNSRAPANELLPGWQVFNGTDELTTIGYNYFPAGNAGHGDVTIIQASAWSGAQGSHFLALSGNNNNNPEFTLQQRGDIPSFGRYLSFQFQGSGVLPAINGQGLPLVSSAIPSLPVANPTIWTFDSSQFAGQQNVLLTFTMIREPFGQPGSLLDNITFAVPEPSTSALLGLGVVGLLWRRCLGKQHSVETKPQPQAKLKMTNPKINPSRK